MKKKKFENLDNEIYKANSINKTNQMIHKSIVINLSKKILIPNFLKKKNK